MTVPRRAADRLWNHACSRIEQELSQKDFQTWILELTPRSFEDGLMTVEAPFGLYRDRIRQVYLPALERAVSEAADHSCRVEVVVGSSAGTRPANRRWSPPAGGQQNARKVTSSPLKSFGNFIVGESNRMACDAARALASAEAGAGNPLFLYGGVGLGKTHLLLAIASELRSRARKVLYYQGEDFTRKMVDALRNDRMDSFRREFRFADALLIDDVQFIAGKKRTQQEFYHAFNLLHGAGKPIALASDRGPLELEKLENGLRSRFQGGLLADLGPLDAELRCRILRAKLKEADLEMEGDTIEDLALRMTGSVREIEGLVSRLRAARSQSGGRLTTQVVESLVVPYVGVGCDVDIETIVKTVATHFGITREEILSRSRARRVAWPRHVAAYLCRKLTSASLPEIGEAMGGRNHSSILRAVRSVKDSMSGEPALAERINRLETLLGRGGQFS
ncbi:MAG: chromosomal replication initiator protein DnaA [bacterium]|nr:chromosomal replication initiator protein DnaA [Candidatus Binatota bacterium]